MRFHSRSPAETRGAARALAGALGVEGLVVVLQGPLGAGKTEFAKGVAEGLGIDRAGVASPTFVIAQEFAGPSGRRLVHVDLYRLENEAELEAAGWRDWLAPQALVLVEWGERFPEALPQEHLTVELVPGPEGHPEERWLCARADGPEARAVLARWEGAVAREAPAAPGTRS